MRVQAMAAVVMGLAGAIVPVAPVDAAECHAKPIRAKGGVSIIEATAKSRARSTWIKKVRADKRLGKEFAAWLRAKNPSYNCRKSGKSISCEAAATPCRLEPVASR